MSFDDLPSEMVVLILSFNPGLDVGIFCQVSKQCNKLARTLRRKMYLIHKVRQGFINNSGYLVERHNHYWSWEELQQMYYPYYPKTRGYMTMSRYRVWRKRLLNFYEGSFCDGCSCNVGLLYYVYVDKRSNPYSGTCGYYSYCYDCYKRGIVKYYNLYGELPTAVDSGNVLYNMIRSMIRETVPEIPQAITLIFDRLEGGIYFWLPRTDNDDFSSDDEL